MDKYLFRAKRKDNDEWIEGGYCYCGNESYIVVATRYMPDTRDWDEADYYENNPVYKPTFIKVYSETVGQYTGLTDKNGKKIFEGDILEFSDRYVVVFWHTHLGCWDSNFLKFTNRENGRDDMSPLNWGYKSKVIGNIHDNPELLNN